MTLTSGNQIKFLAAGREHSHVVTQDTQGTCTSPTASIIISHSYCLATGYTQLYSFGNNMYGQLGIGKSKHDSSFAEQVLEVTPAPVEGIDGNITHIACGLDNTVFTTGNFLKPSYQKPNCSADKLLDKNHIYAMGWGPDGQLGFGPDSSSDKSTPTAIPIMEGKYIAKLSGSTDFSLVLTSKHRYR